MEEKKIQGKIAEKTEAKPEEKKIKVERETYTKDDKTYFSYFIKGVIRGREVRIAVVPPDNGGFRVLDIVFDNAMSADLVLKPYEIKDDKGKVLKGNTYAVVSKDKDGMPDKNNTNHGLTWCFWLILRCARVLYVQY